MSEAEGIEKEQNDKDVASDEVNKAKNASFPQWKIKEVYNWIGNKLANSVVHSAIMVLATVAIAISAWQQYSINDRQADIMQSQTDIIAKQLSATQKQLRAYVNFSGADSMVTVSGKRAQVNITFQNVGNTPAREIIFFGTLVLIFPMYSIQFEADTTIRSQTSCGPQGTMGFTLKTESNVTDEQIKDAETGFKEWYISAKVTYTDIFGGHDSTGVALRWIPKDGGWIARQEIDAKFNYAN